MKHRCCQIAGASAALLLAIALGGCGRSDTRVNSDAGPGRPSRADGGDKAVGPTDPNRAGPTTDGKNPNVGTDSTGRPSDASGGTTGGGANSGTSGTATQKENSPPAK